MNAVMNIGLHKMQGISVIAEELLASQEGVYFTYRVSK